MRQNFFPQVETIYPIKSWGHNHKDAQENECSNRCNRELENIKKNQTELKSTIVIVQLLSCFWLFVTPWTAAHQASLSLTVSQTHVHWVDDAIQSSHPLSSPSPPAFSLSQHQGLFQWVGSSHQVTKVLELQLQHQSFQWIFRTDFF